MESTFVRVREMVCARFSVEPVSVTPETNIVVDLGPDSLEQAELLIDLEAEFGIDMEGAEEEFAEVQALVNRIDAELEKREGPRH